MIGINVRAEIINKFNQYRASDEGRAAFRALVSKQTLHQNTIDAVDQAIELAYVAGAVAGHEILIDKIVQEDTHEG